MITLIFIPEESRAGWPVPGLSVIAITRGSPSLRFELCCSEELMIVAETAFEVNSWRLDGGYAVESKGDAYEWPIQHSQETDTATS
jgi:hypothetical protein